MIVKWTSEARESVNKLQDKLTKFQPFRMEDDTLDTLTNGFDVPPILLFCKTLFLGNNIGC